MFRRTFLKLFAPLLGGLSINSVARSAPIPKQDSLLFRGKTISVFNRDGVEIVVEGSRLTYDGSKDGGCAARGYRGEREFISWEVRFRTNRAYAGYVSETFYGNDARERAEEAARTWTLACRGGWPCLAAPDKVGPQTYGDGGLPIANR
jgi:hypothetical protein